jgi:hypothetical protein
MNLALSLVFQNLGIPFRGSVEPYGMKLSLNFNPRKWPADDLVLKGMGNYRHEITLQVRIYPTQDQNSSYAHPMHNSFLLSTLISHRGIFISITAPSSPPPLHSTDA